ncbi:MAG: sterol desaturase family protein [bacterium]|nr:sterol desaturase family protein [bacterium]
MATHPGHLEVAVGTFLFQFTLYVILAGSAFWLVHASPFEVFRRRRIATEPVSRAQLNRELRLSVVTMIIFGAVGGLMNVLNERGIVHVCIDGDCGGPAYTGLMTLVLVLAHDTYFYWTHRWLHTPWLFRHFHIDHHRSKDPTPLSVLAHHPVDAFLSVGFLYAVIVVVPVPVASILMFQVVLFVFNVLGHLGLEYMPAGYVRTPLFAWLNSPTHHHLHHRATHYNHGLYFNFWDRLCGTEHPEYAGQFEANAARR